MASTAATLLDAWEHAAAVAPLDRAPSLLHSLGALPGDTALGELTVGQCDAHLFRLRRAIFGETAEVLATCPGCQAEVEITVPLAGLQPPVLDDAPAPLVLDAGGYIVSCRVPRNQDLSALTARGAEATLQDLVERCVLDARTADDRPIAAGELPDGAVEAIAEEMAVRDPGAHTPLEIRCACGQEWTDELDIRALLWADLTDWVGRTLSEVHQLALSYGWSEGEILAMSAWRRRWYLEAMDT